MTTPTPTPTEPALILTYGPPGFGKTTDCGFSFPNGLFIAARGALQSIRTVCGYEPCTEEAKTIDDVTKRIKSLKKGEFDTVVVDDFSFLAEQTMAVYEKKYQGFKLWGAMRESTLDFRNAARYADCHIILNCWEQEPKAKQDGSRVRGGPNLSGKLPEQLPALCDLVLRCGQDSMRKPWPGIYRCFLDSNYVMKDRFNIAQMIDPAPMNLAEIMRTVGYKVSRHRDLPWQEDVVENVAQTILAAPPASLVTVANDAYRNLTSAGATPAAARWTIRDACDRAVIRRAMTTRNDSFFV